MKEIERLTFDDKIEKMGERLAFINERERKIETSMEWWKRERETNIERWKKENETSI